MGRYGVKERNVEGQMVVDFMKIKEMSAVNVFQEGGGAQSDV